MGITEISGRKARLQVRSLEFNVGKSALKSFKAALLESDKVQASAADSAAPMDVNVSLNHETSGKT